MNVAEDEFILKSIFNLDSESLVSSTGSSAFDRMMKFFRVLKHVPSEFVIRHSSKYGKHCQSIQNHNGNHNSMSMIGPYESEQPYQNVSRVLQYPQCHRPSKSCISCRLNVPFAPLAKAKTDDDPNFTHHKDIDFYMVYNKCVPNIPSDLKCPSCHNSKRTLQLVLHEYLTSSVSIRNNSSTLLTYNPIYEFENEHDNDESDDKDSFMKQALTIICDVCEFALLLPASPCSTNQCEIYGPSSNQLYASSIPKPLRQQTFVTTKCVNEYCYHPVICQSCTGKSIVQQRKSNLLFASIVQTSNESLFCSSCTKRMCRLCIDKCKTQIDHKTQTLKRYCDRCQRKLERKRKHKKVTKKKAYRKQKKRKKNHDSKKRGENFRGSETSHYDEHKETFVAQCDDSCEDITSLGSDQNVAEYDNCMLNVGYDDLEYNEEDNPMNFECEDEDEENKEWDYYD